MPLRLRVSRLLRGADGAPRAHQAVDERLPRGRIEVRIAHAPEAARDDEIAAVGCDEVLGGHRNIW